MNAFSVVKIRSPGPTVVSRDGKPDITIESVEQVPQE
jgi:hypothetical protein